MKLFLPGDIVRTGFDLSLGSHLYGEVIETHVKYGFCYVKSEDDDTVSSYKFDELEMVSPSTEDASCDLIRLLKDIEDVVNDFVPSIEGTGISRGDAHAAITLCLDSCFERLGRLAAARRVPIASGPTAKGKRCQ